MSHDCSFCEDQEEDHSATYIYIYKKNYATRTCSASIAMDICGNFGIVESCEGIKIPNSETLAFVMAQVNVKSLIEIAVKTRGLDMECKRYSEPSQATLIKFLHISPGTVAGLNEFTNKSMYFPYSLSLNKSSANLIDHQYIAKKYLLIGMFVIVASFVNSIPKFFRSSSRY